MNRLKPDAVLDHIMIVDDNEANVHLLVNILKSYGYSVRPYLSAASALRSAAKTPPELILLDIKMPEMDGFEFCRLLKASPLLKEIPVIFISVLTEANDKIMAFKYGGVDYITKPFHVEELIARIKTHIAIVRTDKQLKAALAEKEVLLREIHHRVKNNLMVITSLIQMQSEQTADPAAQSLFRDLHNRVMAMSMVHEDLYRAENLEQIDFSAYLERLTLSIRQGFSRVPADIRVIAENINLDVSRAIPCGLVVAELATNAFKYAFPVEKLKEMKNPPEIRVELRKSSSCYHLIVRDNGIGLPADFEINRCRTLGMTLVRSWIKHQLKGNITIETHQGASFHIAFT